MARITMRKTKETKLSEIFTLYLASAAARGVKDKTLRTYEQHFNAISKRIDAIVGFTSLAIAHIDDDKTVLRDYLEKISVSSEHLLSLINDVLDMSQIESGKIQIQESECSVPALAHGLRSILQSAIASKNIDFYIDTVDVEHENIYCDKLRVNQILINIASNAVKYTQMGGVVRVKFAEISGATEGYADFAFSVSDTGIGMSEEFLKTIFERRVVK